MGQIPRGQTVIKKTHQIRHHNYHLNQRFCVSKFLNKELWPGWRSRLIRFKSEWVRKTYIGTKLRFFKNDSDLLTHWPMRWRQFKILSNDKANGLPEKYPHIRFRWFLISFPMFISTWMNFILEGYKRNIIQIGMFDQLPLLIRSYSTI